MSHVRRGYVSTGRVIVTVFTPLMLAYLISELYRNINAVIAPQLRSTLHVGPEALGLLSSVFLVAIAAAQIPVGVLLDRYGSGRVVALLMALAAVGAWLFTIPSYPIMLCGRFLIGLGLGACWAGAYRANVLWWRQERLPLVNGALLGLSGLGALAATRPTEAALHFVSWQTVFIWLAVGTVLIALLVAYMVPAESADTKQDKATFRDVSRELWRVATHPLFLSIAPVTFVCEGTWLAYQGLWGGVWLRRVAGMNATTAADVLFWFALAIVMGQILLSALTSRLVKRGFRLETVMSVMIALFIAVQLLIVLIPRDGSYPLWILFGLLTVGPILAYAWLTTELPGEWAGRLISLLNLCATFAGFVLQYAIGWFVELWPVDGHGVYPIAAYRWAFALLVAAQGIAWLRFCGIRRRQRRSVESTSRS